MGADLAFACDCGALKGSLRKARPQDGARLTCSCSDCQAFTFHLGREDDILDPWGGTEIVQLLPAKFEIMEGEDNLACVRVTDKGILRWYAACCRTPIANTAGTAKLPFVGSFFHIYAPEARETAIGPSKGRVFEKEAWSPPQTGAPLKPIAIMGRNLIRILIARLSGAWRTNAFFDTASDEPRATPYRLSAEERSALGARIEERRAQS